MQPTFRIIITEEALRDLDEIALYIRQDSPQNAAAVADELLAAIDSLVKMPARARRAGKSRKRRLPIHAMVVSPFIIYFRNDISASVVHVLRVIHGARRQPRRFP